MLDWLLARKCGTLREEYAQSALWYNRPKQLQWLMDNGCPVDLDALKTHLLMVYKETDEVYLILCSWEERDKKKRSPLQLLHSD